MAWAGAGQREEVTERGLNARLYPGHGGLTLPLGAVLLWESVLPVTGDRAYTSTEIS